MSGKEWGVVAVFVYALLLGLAWSVVRGGTLKPDPRMTELQKFLDQAPCTVSKRRWWR